MIGLDTNVLVRYLTQDDPIQSPQATRLIEQKLSEANPGFVSVVAIVETVWVLERAYGFAALEIATAIENALQADALVIEKPARMPSADVISFRVSFGAADPIPL